MRSVSASASAVVDSPGFSSSTRGMSSGCDNGLTIASDKKSASSQERRSVGLCFKFELVVERWWSTRIIASTAGVCFFLVGRNPLREISAEFSVL